MSHQEVAHESLPLSVELHEMVEVLQSKGAPIFICSHSVLVGDSTTPSLLHGSHNITRLLALVLLRSSQVKIEELEVEVVVI